MSNDTESILYNAKQTMFSKLQTVKSQFNNSAVNQIDLMDKIFDDQVTFAESEVVGASGRIYTFASSSVDNLSIKVYDVIRTGGDELTQIGEVLDINKVDALLGQVNSIVEGVDNINVSDILTDIADGIGINTAIADITRLFQSNVNLTYSDLYNALQNIDSLSTNDSQTLLRTFASGMSEGKLSQYSYMSVLSLLCKQYTDSINDSSKEQPLELDTTKAFVLQGIVSTMLSIVSTVLSTVLTLLSYAFGAIMMVLGTLMNGLGSFLNQYVNNNVDVDLFASNFYVKGPINYLEYNYSDLDNNHWLARVNPEVINLYPGNSIHTYVWYGNQKFFVNSYINPQVDFRAFIANAFSVGSQAKKSSGSAYTFCFTDSDVYGSSSDIFNQDYTLSYEDTMTKLADPRVATAMVLESLVFTLWVTGTHSAYAPSSSYSYFVRCPLTLISSGINNADDVAQKVEEIIGLSLDYYFNNPTSKSTYLQQVAINSGTGDIVSIIQKIYNVLVDNYANDSSRSYGTYTSNAAVADQGAVITSISCYNNFISGFPSGVNVVEPISVDSVPQDRCLTIPNISRDNLIAALTILTTAAIATVAITAAASIAYKKWSLKQQVNGASKVAKLKEAYEANPEDGTKWNDFYRAQKHYNLKAKIFGYRTYDASNGWFNDKHDFNLASTPLSGSSGSILGSSLSKVTSAATDSALAKAGINTANQSIDHNFATIYTTITGQYPTE